jgi:hypothetical protein
MPPKEKKPKKKPTQKQKQKQSQSIKVIVNVPEAKKPKRKSKPRKKRGAGGIGVEGVPVDFKAFPPQIIYPSLPRMGEFGSGGIMEAPRVPVGLSNLQKIEPSGLLEDVGATGTSQIIDVPTRKEQLADLGDVVPLKADTPPPPLEKVARMAYQPRGFTDLPSPMVGMSSEDLVSPFPSSSDEFTVRNPMLGSEFGLKKRAPRRPASPNPRDFTPPSRPGIKRGSKEDLITRYSRLTDVPLAPKITIKELKEKLATMEDL